MEEALVTAPSKDASLTPSKEASLTPPSMYSWRVAALRTWLGEKSKGGAAITMEMLNTAGHLDQLHYQGVRANDDIITLLQVRPEDRLLDVGSGLGGPARYIARQVSSLYFSKSKPAPTWVTCFSNAMGPNPQVGRSMVEK